MIKLKSELPTRSRRHCPRWLLLLLLLAAPLAGLVEERWRGRWALQSWKHTMEAKGESFDAAKIWPPVSPESVAFSNALTQITKCFPAPLRVYSGYLASMTLEASGMARRGSQDSCPPLPSKVSVGNPTNTWQSLDDLLQQSQPGLQQLRALLKSPPTGVNYDVATVLDGNAMPNFVGHRVAAQTLHASALNQLHQGDLAGASQDLQALLSFGKVGDQDPGLVAFMIRIAILGLSVDVCWDALQAPDWTEPQLAALQAHCLDLTNVLSQLPHTLEAERVARIHALGRFRSQSYLAWVARYRELYQGFGAQLPSSDAAPPVLWRRQWVTHPVWSFAWADQEELNYLQAVQSEVTALRETARKPSYLWLQEQVTANRQNYRAPAAAWRFYGPLPFVDHFLTVLGPTKLPESAYPYPDFSKAWFVAMKNLTLHEMVITTIALKRYALKHGQPPTHLAAMVPEFLPASPIDLMNGQPLRYRSNADGTFVLYSVGANLRDDGGNFVSESTAEGHPDPPPWSGRDWVWPQGIAGQ